MCLPFFIRNLCVLVLTGSQWSLIVDARLREGVVIHCIDTHVYISLSVLRYDYIHFVDSAGVKHTFDDNYGSDRWPTVTHHSPKIIMPLV